MKQQLRTILAFLAPIARKSASTTLWMLKITLPVSLAVTIAMWSGCLQTVCQYLGDLFPAIGLPKEGAVVFITSCMLPIYAPIALMSAMTLTLRQATILSLMCLASHNLPVECAVARKTGSSFLAIMTLRLMSSFTFAVVANLILPQSDAMFACNGASGGSETLVEALERWATSSLNLVELLAVIVTALMTVQSLMEKFGLMKRLGALLAPVMRLSGLPESTSFLWLVGQIVGLSYGSAIMVAMCEEGSISSSDADLVNRHLAVNHSMLEDSLLFASLGVCWWILLLFRVPMAILLVKFRRMQIAPKPALSSAV